MPRIGRVQSSTGIYHVILHGASTTCEYDYDCNGALIRDGNRGINNITYDYGHHPQRISMSTMKGWSTIGRTNNIINDYTPDGRKLSSIHTTSSIKGRTIKETSRNTDLYIDGLILRNGKPQMWQFGGGYVELDDNGTPTSWNYYITDHLGSTRMVVDSNNNIKETINYYPFGSEMRMENPALMVRNNKKISMETAGFAMPSDSAVNIKEPGILMPIDSVAKGNEPALASADFWQRYRFSGKELDKQNGLNMYDFGARLFDVAGVPMWTSVDPLAEKFYPFTPYNYCAGDPVNKVDPDGKEKQQYLKPKELIKSDYYQYPYNTPGVLNVWAHGVYLKKYDEFAYGIDVGRLGTVSNAEEFHDAILKYSSEWNENGGENMTIVLHACGTSEFAKKLSEDDMFKGKNITFVAPNAKLRVNSEGSKVNGKIFFQDGTNFTKRIKTEEGRWMFYKDGKLVDTESATAQPGKGDNNLKERTDKKKKQEEQ